MTTLPEHIRKFLKGLSLAQAIEVVKEIDNFFSISTQELGMDHKEIVIEVERDGNKIVLITT